MVSRRFVFANIVEWLLRINPEPDHALAGLLRRKELELLFVRLCTKDGKKLHTYVALTVMNCSPYTFFDFGHNLFNRRLPLFLLRLRQLWKVQEKIREVIMANQGPRVVVVVV